MRILVCTALLALFVGMLCKYPNIYAIRIQCQQGLNGCCLFTSSLAWPLRWRPPCFLFPPNHKMGLLLETTPTGRARGGVIGDLVQGHAKTPDPTVCVCVSRHLRHCEAVSVGDQVFDLKVVSTDGSVISGVRSTYIVGTKTCPRLSRSSKIALVQGQIQSSVHIC